MQQPEIPRPNPREAAPPPHTREDDLVRELAALAAGEDGFGLPRGSAPPRETPRDQDELRH